MEKEETEEKEMEKEEIEEEEKEMEKEEIEEKDMEKEEIEEKEMEIEEEKEMEEKEIEEMEKEEEKEMEKEEIEEKEVEKEMEQEKEIEEKEMEKEEMEIEEEKEMEKEIEEIEEMETEEKGKNKRIIIFLHFPFNLSDGGVTVQYTLAEILYNFGEDVFVCNKCDNNSENTVFNRFIDIDEIKEEDKEDTVVIYCEGIEGNPLKSKYVVRWMLSKLGQNVNYSRYFTWGENDLIYFFNSEREIIDKSVDVKYLSFFYLYPLIENYKWVRRGECFTERKSNFIHKNKSVVLHDNTAFEITKQHLQTDYIEIFNKYEIFISYDPLTFLTIIAALCGCVSVVVPMDGISKKDYFKMTALYDYMLDKNIDTIYGIAYGMSEEEIDYSKTTMHLLRDQIDDFKIWSIEKYVKSFVSDIKTWSSNNNTLSQYGDMMLEGSGFPPDFDAVFYRANNVDLHGKIRTEELLEHYRDYGKSEGRFASSKEMRRALNKNSEDFDPELYRKTRNLYGMSLENLVAHYNTFGKDKKDKDREEKVTRYIIARYTEDISWLDDEILKDTIVYNKGDPLININNVNIPNEILLKNNGREAESYLNYIIDNYDNLPDICIFSQGCIEDHLEYRSANDNGSLCYLKQLKEETLRWGKSTPVKFTDDVCWSDTWNMYVPHGGKELNDGSLYLNGIILPFIDWFHANVDPNLNNLDTFYPNAIFGVCKELIRNRPLQFYENLLTQVNWSNNPIEGAFMERSWYYIFSLLESANK